VRHAIIVFRWLGKLGSFQAGSLKRKGMLGKAQAWQSVPSLSLSPSMAFQYVAAEW
jgi:hypothetical protein